MGFHEPPRGGRGATAGAIHRGIAAALLLMAAVACGRSELDGSETFDDGGAGGKAGGSSTSGRGGNGVAGNGVAGFGVGGNGVAGFGVGGNGVAGFGVGGYGVGGGGSAENCNNGIDDDHDGNIDCADPDCGDFTCAPSAPNGGWVGPLAIWQGSGSPPSCANASGFPLEVANANAGIKGSASCPSCSCDAPQGVACQVGAAQLYRDSTCAGASGTLTIAQGNCTAFVSLSYDPASVRWGSAPPGGGACVPKTTGSASFPPVAWDTQMRACGDPTPNKGGCAAGTCVPRQQAPFGQAMCVYQRGDLPCPVGAYSVKSVYYTGADDARGCSACGCSSPTGTTCTGTMKLYTDQNCSVDETTLTNVLECSPLAPDPTPPSPPYMSLRSVVYTGTASSTGSCLVQPSVQTGAAIPTDPVTLCCTP